MAGFQATLASCQCLSKDIAGIGGWSTSKDPTSWLIAGTQFDPESGTFVSTQTGLYRYSFQVQIRGSAAGRQVFLLRNGSPTKVISLQESGWTTSSATLYLAQGDTLSLSTNCHYGYIEAGDSTWFGVEWYRELNDSVSVAPPFSRVVAVVAGTGIGVDDTDPTMPVVSNEGVLAVAHGLGITSTTSAGTSTISTNLTAAAGSGITLGTGTGAQSISTNLTAAAGSGITLGAGTGTARAISTNLTAGAGITITAGAGTARTISAIAVSSGFLALLTITTSISPGAIGGSGWSVSTAPGFNLGGNYTLASNSYAAPATGYYQVMVNCMYASTTAQYIGVNIGGVLYFAAQATTNSVTSSSVFRFCQTISLTLGQVVSLTLEGSGVLTLNGPSGSYYTNSWSVWRTG